eukprot:7422372-Pyramimonas_sp.AAC.1
MSSMPCATCPAGASNCQTCVPCVSRAVLRRSVGDWSGFNCKPVIGRFPRHPFSNRAIRHLAHEHSAPRIQPS